MRQAAHRGQVSRCRRASCPGLTRPVTVSSPTPCIGAHAVCTGIHTGHHRRRRLPPEPGERADGVPSTSWMARHQGAALRGVGAASGAACGRRPGSHHAPSHSGEGGFGSRVFRCRSSSGAASVWPVDSRSVAAVTKSWVPQRGHTAKAIPRSAPTYASGARAACPVNLKYSEKQVASEHHPSH